MIHIMKASAGSGKTFNLTRTYIGLLLGTKDRFAYRHVLAVTFTNKATDEMKNRILKELSILASAPEESGYFRDFCPSPYPSAQSLAEAAQDILCNILHDYGAFSVSTIDKFFQQVLRAFSREIGQFASYQVELDRSALVEETVDRMLDALTEDDKELLKWLTDSVVEQLEQGGRFSMENNLKQMAVKLLSPKHREAVERLGLDESKIYSKTHLAKVKTACRNYIKDYKDRVRTKAGDVCSAMERAGVGPDDFYRGFMSDIFRFCDLKPRERVELPKSGFVSRASDPELWFPKAKARLLPVVEPVLAGPLADFLNLFLNDYIAYNTAEIIVDQIYTLGVAGELYRGLQALMKEKNVLSLDDSNEILKGIIDGSDAPFVYEKMGVWYEHFLLDEFQDTSRIQWENFLPLLKESDGNGRDNLIVGDVKQSIYRWRNSDWNMLDHELQQTFQDARVTTLDTNYRSATNIVDFNNAFFTCVAGKFDIRFGESAPISRIYEDVAQKCHKTEPGCVRLTFCDAASELDQVFKSVQDAFAAGAAPGDVAVLVRTNTSGGEVAKRLIAEGIKVVTDDSLKVKVSVTVRRMAALLTMVDNPSDSIGQYMASSLGIISDAQSVPRYRSLVDLCEWLARKLRDYDSATFDAETLYIQSFMDFVQDYSSNHGNGLHSFLKAWETADPNIASPDQGDAVRIMTIHKAKGLAFPYVIFPFCEKVELYKSDHVWCSPDLSGTPLSGIGRGLYDVNLTSSTEASLFAPHYRQEYFRQHVDNLNVLYVALTRPAKAMHLISKAPPKNLLKAVGNGQDNAWQSIKDLSQALWLFARTGGGIGIAASGSEECQEFILGTMPSFTQEKTSARSAVQASYLSWPLNPSGSRPRLVLSSDNKDFFAFEQVDESSSSRNAAKLRGTVLHNILSSVRTIADIDTSVQKAVMAGELTAMEGSQAAELLHKRVAAAIARGWFSGEARVLNEVDVADSDGSLHRPDRVEVRPDGSVLIIDYKFGRHRPEYEEQLKRYADLWKRMGYKDVGAALWYVDNDEVRYIIPSKSIGI